MTTILFPDASESNSEMPDAPVQVARAAIGAVKDVRYEHHKATAAQRGRPFMAYAFLNHDALTLTVHGDGSGISAEQQADFAFSVIGPDVPCMLDWESNRGRDATVDMAWRFIERYRSHGGILHSIYLPHWYWKDHIEAPDLRPFEAAGLGFVSSNYPDVGYTENGPGWAGYGGIEPFQWQFTDNWLGSGSDGNAFKGTPEQWWAIVTGGDPMSEWAATPDNAKPWALTQGTAGFAGQQRDTALAFAWQSAHEAKENTDKILAAVTHPAPVQVDAAAVAAALAANPDFVKALAVALSAETARRG